MKKIISIMLCLLLIIAAFTGCETGKTRSFVYFIDAIPHTLDPQLARTAGEITAVTNAFEGLFRKNLEGKIETAAAESYTVTDDGLEYTIALKPDLTYNLGWDKEKKKYVTAKDEIAPIAVTAHDFVFAFQRIFDSNTNSPYVTDFQAIKNASDVIKGSAGVSSIGVAALDDHTIKFTLSYPDPEFLTKLCLAGAMPCNKDFFEYCAGAYGLMGETKPAQNLMTNGEFAVTVWNEADGVTLRRDVKSNTIINRIRLVTEKVMFDTDTAQGSKKDDDAPVYPTAEERLSEEISNGEILTYQNQSGYNQTIFSVATWTISFNCSDKYFANQNIRKGIYACTGFSAFNSGNSLLSRASGLIPPSVTLYDKSFRDYSDLLPISQTNGADIYRTGLAELYEQDVISEKTKLGSVTVLVPDIPEIVELSSHIFQVWQRDLSAFFTVEVIPLAQLNERVAAGDYQIAFYPFAANVNDSYNLLSRFQTDNSQNVWGFSNERYDLRMQQIRESIGISNRAAQYVDAEKALLDYAVVVPLWYENSFFATQGVKNVLVNPFGPVLDLTWAEEE